VAVVPDLVHTVPAQVVVQAVEVPALEAVQGHHPVHRHVLGVEGGQDQSLLRE
jgi:hypothetical protein